MSQRNILPWAFRVAAILAVGVLAVWLAPHHCGVAARLAWFAATLGLAGSIASYRITDGAIGPGTSWSLRDHAAWTLRHFTLYLAVAGAIFQIILLTMRSVYFSIDLVHGYPWLGLREFGFGPMGLVTIGVLCAACTIGLVGSRDGRLATAQFWLLVLLTLWACTLLPAFQPTQTGGYVRSDATLILVECLASLALISVLVFGWLADSGFFQSYAGGPTGHAESGLNPLPHGFRTSIAVMALALNIAVLFQVLVPSGLSPINLRLSGLRAGCAAAIATAGCFYLLRRSWSSQLADAGLGLFSLTLCGLATLAIPSNASPLAEQYPMLFNALMIGYAFSAALYSHWTDQWSRKALHPHSLRARLIPHLKRFAFLSSATALLAGVMMCFWPGMPGISAMDHSFGRVLAGFSAFMFLLLVSLRSARLMARASFHILTFAVACSLVAFLLVRAMPFVSEQPQG